MKKLLLGAGTLVAAVAPVAAVVACGKDDKNETPAIKSQVSARPVTTEGFVVKADDKQDETLIPYYFYSDGEVKVGDVFKMSKKQNKFGHKTAWNDVYTVKSIAGSTGVVSFNRTYTEGKGPAAYEDVEITVKFEQGSTDDFAFQIGDQSAIVYPKTSITGEDAYLEDFQALGITSEEEINSVFEKLGYHVTTIEDRLTSLTLSEK